MEMRWKSGNFRRLRTFRGRQSFCIAATGVNKVNCFVAASAARTRMRRIKEVETMQNYLFVLGK